jgi:hypothetical protein
MKKATILLLALLNLAVVYRAFSQSTPPPLIEESSPSPGGFLAVRQFSGHGPSAALPYSHGFGRSQGFYFSGMETF